MFFLMHHHSSKYNCRAAEEIFRWSHCERGSIASLAGSVDNDTVMARRKFTRTEYNDSKLALLLLTKELARKITDAGIH